MARDKKQTGKVKWFNVTKGYGFIIPDDGSEELFVHQSAVHAEGFRSLREGESVEFASERGEDGRMRAAEVTGPDGAHVLGAQPPGYGGGGGGGGGGSGSGSGSSRGRTAGRATGRRDSSEQQLCYNCNEPGHLSRDCGVEQRPGRRPGGGGGGGRGGYAAAATGRSGGACFTCGGQGHFARDCTAATNGAPSPAAAAAAAASN